MAIPARTSRPGTFFVTSRTYNSRRLFQIAANAYLFLATLQHYRAAAEYKLHAFVVMPDHIHLLLTPTQTLERAMSLIKGGFSHRLASKLPVWQRSDPHQGSDHRIRDREDFGIRRTYIHQNPVRAHLTPTPELYPYSSANSSRIPSP